LKRAIRAAAQGPDAATPYLRSHDPYPDIVLEGDDLIRVVGTVVRVITPDIML